MSSRTFFRSNQHGSAMVAVMALAIILNITLLAFFFTSRHSSKTSGIRKKEVTALNIAEAGKEQVLAQLRDREIRPRANQTDSVVYSDYSFGSGTYSVRYSTNARNDTITISSIGKTGNARAEVEVVALLTPFGWRNWIQGAVTLPNPYTSLGDFVVDGRDHDLNGVHMGIGGPFGVSSGGSVSPGGSSIIGGGTTAPQGTILEGETVQSNIDTTGYPRTPEEVLNLPPNTLDSFITGCPSPPLSGITYVTGGCGDYSGSGILICHNSSGTATLDNWKGDFDGLVIADEEKHFNGNDTILGAVILLGRNSGGNTFGNGNTSILYSSLMIEEVIKNAYDLANKRWAVPVISWRQVK